MRAYKLYFTIFLCSVLLAHIANAQYSFSYGDIDNIKYQPEISISVGGTNFLGDLGGTPGEGKPFVKDFLFQTVRPYIGISAAWNQENWLAFKGSLGYTVVNGADSLINNEGGQERWRAYRNASFRSRIFEASAMGQIRPLTLLDPTRSMHTFSPFIGLGVGMFHFNPQTQYKGVWVDLRPLHLEGQGFPEYPERKEYKLTQLYIPVEAGVTYYMKNRTAFSVSALFRKTFTDYIDDVSTTYIDPKLFNRHLSPDAATLARQLYSTSIRPDKVRPNVGKGNARIMDNYVSVVLTFSIFLKGEVPVYYPGRPRRERLY